MNISSQISSNSSVYFYDDTEWNTYLSILIVTYIIHFLFNFPINSYVVWLIIRGTGNGLLAEIFLLNLSVCEIILSVHSLLKFILYLCYFLNMYNNEITYTLLDLLYGFIVTGHPLFQCLICVERYLAVVHPVTFLKYKPLRYRLMCSVIAWGTCFGSCIFYFINTYFWIDSDVYIISDIAQCFLFLFIQLFCCLAVLRVLKQSGPGERGREKEEENNMKRRVFLLILITTVGMVFTYGVQTILEVVYWYTSLTSEIKQPISYVCCLIAGLVQPLLFLHRVGKLNFIKCQ